MNLKEGQRSWGWLVIVYVFLAGLGGGTFLCSFIMLWLNQYTEVGHIGALIGPLFVLVGTALLLLDLGSAKRAYRLFTNPATLVSSWMIRGAWILSGFIILGLAFALPAFGPFSWLPWTQDSGLGRGIGIAAGLFAIVVPIYPGLLLGVIRSIPLWNTSILPPLFFLSSLDNGVAAFVVTSLLLPSVMGIAGFHLLGIGSIILIILVLITIGAYVEIVRQTGVTAAASVRLLKTPLFVVGVILTGLIVPLVLVILSTTSDNIQTVRILEGISGVLVLAGGLLLRYCVVKFGVRIIVR